MLLKRIRYFQAVVRCGSFTQAAEECYISQSAISQQVRALEQELGVSLLIRRNRSFSVTPAGEYFYKKSLFLTADFDKICRETARIAHEDAPQLCIGCLKCYSGKEFQQAVAEFADNYPDISIHILNGSHEELYEELRTGRADLIFSDQRRAFSDEYANLLLTTCRCYIEIAARSFIAGMESIDVEELREIPCILAVSQSQRKNEQEYYRDIVGIGGEFLFVDNLEEARLLVVGGKGFMPVEGAAGVMQSDSALRHVALMRSGRPVRRNYCAFWKADNSGCYVEAFAEILRSKFRD